jgi:hypothetical protein
MGARLKRRYVTNETLLRFFLVGDEGRILLVDPDNQGNRNILRPSSKSPDLR